MQELNRLLETMQQLRHPQQGCAWDKQQTFSSLVPHTLEEAYEVADAIERNDINDLRDELGDLLLQVVFYAQIAKEQQLFDFSAICQAITDKLQRRHPHIFRGQCPSATVTTAAGAYQSWEKQKAAERAAKAQHSLLDDIPHHLPALMRAYKIQKRCAAAGFDWDSLAGVVDKVREELDEVLAEIAQTPVNTENLEEEVGDLLFATVNLARHTGNKAEMSLYKASRKFERRFRQLEQIIAAQGYSVDQATPEQLDAAWQQVKAQE